jgi:hypothetical protein
MNAVTSNNRAFMIGSSIAKKKLVDLRELRRVRQEAAAGVCAPRGLSESFLASASKVQVPIARIRDLDSSFFFGDTNESFPFMGSLARRVHSY